VHSTSQRVAGRRGLEHDQVEQPDDLGRQSAQALVVAGLLGQVGEQLPEPVGGPGEEPAVGRAVEQDLGDRQADELRVGDLRRPSGTVARLQEIVGQHIKADQERVEADGHEATSVVDGARTASAFDTPT
jgi:hypothetical protein